MSIIAGMESLLIVIAIVIAVFLTARAVMQPYRPRFAVRKRVPTHGIITRARALGKKCAATERGSGLSIGALHPIVREYKVLQRRSDSDKALTSAQTVCLINRDAVFNAMECAKSAMRKSYALGHVDRRPRIFTLCDMLVSDMHGYLDENILKASVKAFCEHAPLTFSELEGLPDMLRLCLCGLIMKVLGDENARAEVYDDGVRDGGDGKVDIGRLSDSDYLCGVVSAVTKSDKTAFDALLESNAVNIASAERARRRRLALAYSAVLGAVRSLCVADGLTAQTLTELSATDKVFAKIAGYDKADINEKIAYLRACEREARRRGTSELAYAHTVADSAETVGCGIAEYLDVGGRDGKKPVYTAVAVSIVAIMGVIVCLTFSYKYAAVFPILAIAVYAAFRPRIIIPEIGLKRRKPRNKGTVIAEYSPNTKPAYFGGETDYKQNTVEGGIAAVVADNRGRITVKSDCGAAELSLGVSVGAERIGLAAFDGVFSQHKTTYRVAAENAEFSAEFIAPVDGADCSVRITALNRTDSPLAIGIFAAASKHIEQVAQSEFALGKTKSRRERYAVALCSDSACSEHDYTGDRTEFSERFELDGYRKHSIVINALFAEDASLLSRRAVAVCGANGFACDEAAAREYCANADGYVGVREYAPDIAPYKRSIDVAGEVELPTVAYDVAAEFGGFTGDGGLLPRLNGGEIKNILCDGEYCVDLAGDGSSTRLSAQYGAEPIRDDVLTSAFAAIGEGGAVWTPTLRPFGKGNLYAVHRMGYSEFLCGYNGFVCTLRRYIAFGRRGEFFDLTLENKTDKQRETDIMLSVRSDRACGADMDGGRLVARDNNGNAVFAVQSSERVLEFAEFAEGYYNRGIIDRAGGFRAGGVLCAPTVSTHVSILPRSAKRVIFLLREGDFAPFKLENTIADAMFTAEVKRYADCARFSAKTGDRALNRSFMWVQYSLINAVKKRELSDGGNAAGDIVLYRAAEYFDIASVKRKIIKLCKTQRNDGTSGYLSDGGAQSVTELLALPLIAASYVDFTRDFGVLGEHAPFFSDKSEDAGGASVLEHCLRAVDNAVRTYANGAKNICDAMLLRCAVRRYVQYCAESARKKHMEAAVRYADYAVSDSFDGEKFGEYAGEPTDTKISLLPQIMSALTGACNAETAKTALETAKNRLFDASCGKMRLSSDSDEYADSAVILLYVYALYKADCSESAFDVLREYYSRGAIVCDGIGAQALFYSLVAEFPFGVKFNGNKITVNPVIGGNTPDIAFDISTERGRAKITADGSEPRGAWRMRVNNVVYSTDAIDCDREGEFDITLFRNGIAGD